MSISKKQDGAATSKSKRIDRPFSQAILGKARQISGRYQVVIRFDEECEEYFGRGLEVPGALGDGKTPHSCVASTREAMSSIVAFMLERGEKPPAPAVEGFRKVQLNVRVTPEEKLLFEQAARRQGQGLSDYIRTAALSGATRP
jgi:predicted RNase H-like HicB family nuclease